MIGVKLFINLIGIISLILFEYFGFLGQNTVFLILLSGIRRVVIFKFIMMIIVVIFIR